MNKKKRIGCLLAVLTFFLYAPLSFYASYLVYKHIGATDVMWLLFWIQWPFYGILTLSGNIAEKILTDD